MAKYLLLDRTVRKTDDQEKNPLNIKTIEPGSNTRIYFDNHSNAPKGFALRVTPTGNKAWILNYYVQGRERRLTLDRGYPTWGPTKARTEATKLKVRINAGEDILSERAARKAAEQEAAHRKLARKELTLGALCDAYVEQLGEKPSARAVENSLKKNVENAFPNHWKTPAEDLDVDDFLEIVATLADEGKLREAAKLRSYLRAAYTSAIRARTDAAATPAMRKFKLKSNPVSDLAPISGNLKARDRALSLPELRLYWTRIGALPDPQGAILRFHLLTGGQRLEQLFRLTRKNLDDSSITLLDTKGRRTQPRVHVVPLIEEAREALEAIGDGEYLVSFNSGISPATDGQFRRHVSAVSKAMLDAKEIKEKFTPGDLRRTVETRLTEAGLPSDHLKHLLSHGFGGVQDRHYQRYEFRKEKLSALTILFGLLKGPQGEVVQMKQRAKK